MFVGAGSERREEKRSERKEWKQFVAFFDQTLQRVGTKPKNYVEKPFVSFAFEARASESTWTGRIHPRSLRKALSIVSPRPEGGKAARGGDGGEVGSGVALDRDVGGKKKENASKKKLLSVLTHLVGRQR